MVFERIAYISLFLIFGYGYWNFDTGLYESSIQLGIMRFLIKFWNCTYFLGFFELLFINSLNELLNQPCKAFMFVIKLPQFK